MKAYIELSRRGEQVQAAVVCGGRVTCAASAPTEAEAVEAVSRSLHSPLPTRWAGERPSRRRPANTFRNDALGG